MTLSVSITSGTRQNSPSHSAVHNALHATHNAITGQLGTDGHGYLAAEYFNLLHGSSGSPITGLTKTAQISRVEHITVPPGSGNLSDMQFNAALLISVLSKVGNIMQPVAIVTDVTGHSENGCYVVGASIGARHGSGAQGGACAIFIGAHSTVNDVNTSILGIGFSLFNDTGLDITSRTNYNQGGLDIVVDPASTNIFGNGIQFRALGPGLNTIINGFGAVNAAGIDLSGFTFANPAAMVLLDATFAIGFSSSTPIINFDANDYLWYIRSQNKWTFHVGADYLFEIGNWTPGANETGIWIAEGATPTLRQVKWKAGNALGVGDKVLVLA